jgi:hypothetical protein
MKVLVLSVFCWLLLGSSTRHAHVHGVAELNLVIEKAKSSEAQIEVKIPGATIYGFEHKARTTAHKKVIKKQNKKLLDKLLLMVRFPKSHQCVISQHSLHYQGEHLEAKELKGDHVAKSSHRYKGRKGGDHHDKHHDAHHDEQSGNHKKDKHRAEHSKTKHVDDHAELVGIFKIKCQKKLAGATVQFSFKPHFPKFERVDIQILTANQQTGFKVSGKARSVKL